MNTKCIKSKLTEAFSLIELMVVIAIIALLTAIAVPSYQGYLQQSKVTEIFSLASDQMGQWEQQYNLGGGSFPITNSTLGNYITTSYLTATTSGGCTVAGGSLGAVCITLNSTAGNIDTSLNGTVIRFTPTLTGSVSGLTSDTSITWACTYHCGGTTAQITTAGTLLAPGNCGTANGF